MKSGWKGGWRPARGSLFHCAVMLPEPQGGPGLQALAWGCTSTGACPTSYTAAGCPMLEGDGTALSLKANSSNSGELLSYHGDEGPGKSHP